jgi:hypothetical protein
MANEINIGINTTSDLSGLNQVDESVKSLKTQLKEAQANVAALSEKFGATSKEAVEAAKSAAILRDKIGDAKSLTDAFNPDAKFKALSGSLTGVAGGFSAVTGALGLMGKESKDVEKAILKVQSAMAFAGGVQALGESIDSFKQLGAVIKSTTIFQRIATAAQWLWNAALNANPVGAFVVAVTALIGVGYAMIKMFEKSNQTLEVSQKNIERNIKSVEKQTEALENNRKKKAELQDYELRLMKAQGKSEEAIARRALAISKENEAEAWKEYRLKRSTLEMYKNTIATHDATQAELDRKIALEEYGSVLKVHFQEQKKENERSLKDAKEQLKSAIISNNAAAKAVDEANHKKIQSQRDLNIVLTQQQTDANKEAADEQKRKGKEAQDEQKRANDKKIQTEKERIQESENLLKEEIKTSEDLLADTEVKKENLRHERQKKEIEERTVLKDRKKAIEIEEANHTKLLAEAELKDKQVQDEKFNKLTEDEYNKSLEFMEIQDAGYEDDLKKKAEHYQHVKTIQEDYGKSTIDVNKQIYETNKEIAEKEKAIELAKLEMRREVTNKTIDVTAQAGQLLQDIAGKSKGVAIGGIIVEKAASIAGIISSTAQANAQFLANPVSAATLGTAAISPIALNNISAGISIASIIAQSAKSISEINGAKSSDAVGGGSEPAPSKFATGGLVTGMGTSTSDSIIANLSNGESVINAKSTAMFGNLLSNINQAGGGVAFGNQNNANPIFKTYVVASEMTSQIEANLKLKQIARL